MNGASCHPVGVNQQITDFQNILEKDIQTTKEVDCESLVPHFQDAIGCLEQIKTERDKLSESHNVVEVVNINKAIGQLTTKATSVFKTIQSMAGAHLTIHSDTPDETEKFQAFIGRMDQFHEIEIALKESPIHTDEPEAKETSEVEVSEPKEEVKEEPEEEVKTITPESKEEVKEEPEEEVKTITPEPKEEVKEESKEEVKEVKSEKCENLTIEQLWSQPISKEEKVIVETEIVRLDKEINEAKEKRAEELLEEDPEGYQERIRPWFQGTIASGIACGGFLLTGLVSGVIPLFVLAGLLFIPFIFCLGIGMRLTTQQHQLYQKLIEKAPDEQHVARKAYLEEVLELGVSEETIAKSRHALKEIKEMKEDTVSSLGLKGIAVKGHMTGLLSRSDFEAFISNNKDVTSETNFYESKIEPILADWSIDSSAKQTKEAVTKLQEAFKSLFQGGES